MPVGRVVNVRSTGITSLLQCGPEMSLSCGPEPLCLCVNTPFFVVSPIHSQQIRFRVRRVQSEGPRVFQGRHEPL